MPAAATAEKTCYERAIQPMRQVTLSALVQRRFVHCVNVRGKSAADLVREIGLPPITLCHLIAGQNLAAIPLTAYYRIARWLQMPLWNTLLLAGVEPDLTALVRFGMEMQGCRASSTADQERIARAIGISVAVFRRALHGYPSFHPSVQTCDRLANWLAWMGMSAEDIALAAGTVVRYRANGRRLTITRQAAQAVAPYPCACGRAGCIVPAHIPAGPRRQWRSDACRMWARRRQIALAYTPGASARPLPHPPEIVRFIRINERSVPVRF
jgi:transcriptional regulator with XRE-family HTH domain